MLAGDLGDLPNAPIDAGGASSISAADVSLFTTASSLSTSVAASTVGNRNLIGLIPESGTTGGIRSADDTFFLQFNPLTDQLIIGSDNLTGVFDIVFNVEIGPPDDQAEVALRLPFQTQPDGTSLFGVPTSEETIIPTSRMTVDDGTVVSAINVIDNITDVSPQGRLAQGLLNRFGPIGEVPEGREIRITSIQVTSRAESDFAEISAAQLAAPAITFQLERVVLVGNQSEIPFSVSGTDEPLTIEFNFGDGTIERIDVPAGTPGSARQGTVSHVFNQGGLTEVFAQVVAGDQALFNSEVSAFTVVDDAPEIDLAGTFFGENEILALDAFDLSIVDTIDSAAGIQDGIFAPFPAPANVEIPQEVSFGVLQGRIAPTIDFEDLRLDVTLLTDELSRSTEISFRELIRLDGTFSFNVQENLAALTLQGSRSDATIIPRLIGDLLRIELRRSGDDTVIDTIEITPETPGFPVPGFSPLFGSPSTIDSIFGDPRLLDIDLLLDQEMLGVGDELQTDLFLDNVAVFGDLFPDEVIRVEVDFGDGEQFGLNLIASALSPTLSEIGPANPPIDPFSQDVRLFDLLPFRVTEDLREHRFDQTGEFEVTASVSILGGDLIASESRTVTVSELSDELSILNARVESVATSESTIIPRVSGSLLLPDEFAPQISAFLQIGEQTVGVSLETNQVGGVFDFVADFDGLNLRPLVQDEFTLAVVDAVLSFTAESGQTVQQAIEVNIEVPRILGVGGGFRFNVSPGVAVDSVFEIANVGVVISELVAGENGGAVRQERTVTGSAVIDVDFQNQTAGDVLRQVVEQVEGDLPSSTMIVGLAENQTVDFRLSVPDDQGNPVLLDTFQISSADLLSPFFHVPRNSEFFRFVFQSPSIFDNENVINQGGIATLFEPSQIAGLFGAENNSFTIDGGGRYLFRRRTTNDNDPFVNTIEVAPLGIGTLPAIEVIDAFPSSELPREFEPGNGPQEGAITIFAGDLSQGDLQGRARVNSFFRNIVNQEPDLGVFDIPEDLFSPNPLSSEEERTLTFTVLRGIDPNDDAFELERQRRQDLGEIVFTVFDGIEPLEFTVDFDDSVPVMATLPVPDLEQQQSFTATTFEHTFTARFIETLDSENVLNDPSFFGEILISVRDQGGATVDRSVNFFGVERLDIAFETPEQFSGETLTSSALFADELSIDSDFDFEFDVNQASGIVTRQRRLIVGQQVPNLRIPTLALEEFELQLNLGDGQEFFIVRNEADPEDSARLFLGDSADGEPFAVIPWNGVFLDFDLDAADDDGVPLISFPSIGQFEIQTTLTSPFFGVVGFGSVRVGVFPDVNLEVQPDGSLSGNVFLGDTTEDLISDFGQPVNFVLSLQPFGLENPENQVRFEQLDGQRSVIGPPGENVSEANVSFNEDTSSIEFTNILPGRFQSGRRTNVSFLKLMSAGATLQTRVQAAEVKPNLESIDIQVNGSVVQGQPVDATVTLSGQTLDEANNPGEEPFELNIVTGTGGGSVVLFRDANTPEGRFLIQGSDDFALYDPVTGEISLLQEIPFGPDLSLLQFAGAGLQNLTIFSHCAFGTRSIEVQDAVPTVVGEVMGSVDGFGNFQINFEASVPGPGNRVSVENGSAVVEQELQEGQNTVSGNLGQGTQANVNITDTDGSIQFIQTALNLNPTVVNFSSFQDDLGQSFLSLDLTALLDALNLQFDAQQAGNQGSASAEFQINFDDGTPPVTVGLSVLSDAITIAQFGGLVAALNGDRLDIPVTAQDDAAVDVSIETNDQAIEGGATVNLSDTATVQKSEAFLQPEGITTVVGELPHGAQGPVTFTSSSGATFTLDDVVGAQPFVIDQPGLQAGETITANVEGQNVSSVIQSDQKTNFRTVSIDIVPAAGGQPDEFVIQFNVADLVNQTLEDLEPGQVDEIEGNLLVLPPGIDINNLSPAEFAGLLLTGQSTRFSIVVGDNPAAVGESEPEAFISFSDTDFNFISEALENTFGVQDLLNPLSGGEVGIANLPTTVEPNQTVQILIFDNCQCFGGQAAFTNNGAGVANDLISGLRRIIQAASSNGPNQTSGEINVGGATEIQATSTGGTTTIGDTTIPSGQTATVPVDASDRTETVIFNFVSDAGEADADDSGAGEIQFQIPDSVNPSEGLEITTEVFFVTPVDPLPAACADHDQFPDDVVFAGNVELTFVDGNLTLSGNDANNGVVVFTDDRGIVVLPVGGTTLNGSAEAIVIAEGTTLLGDLIVSGLGEGDDLLCLADFVIDGATNILATPGDDVVLATGIAFGDVTSINVGTGDDVVDLSGSGSDAVVTVNLGDGNDLFVGSSGDDVVFGGAGDDIIDGAGGNDQFTVGEGADDIFGGDGVDGLVFDGTDGDDVVRLVEASDVGEAGDGTHPSADLDITATSPEAFTVEISDVESITVNGLAGDDQLEAANASENLAIDGGTGSNLIRILGGDVNLTNTGNVLVQNLGVIDLRSQQPGTPVASQITIDATIAQAVSTDDVLLIRADTREALNFTDVDDLRIDGAVLLEGALVRRIREQSSGNFFDVDIPLLHQNPLRPTDVDNNGMTTALDALLVINQLATLSSSGNSNSLTIPSTPGEFPTRFVDVNGGDDVTALDALLVINFLGTQVSAGLTSDETSEGEFEGFSGVAFAGASQATFRSESNNETSLLLAAENARVPKLSSVSQGVSATSPSFANTKPTVWEADTSQRDVFEFPADSVDALLSGTAFDPGDAGDQSC